MCLFLNCASAIEIMMFLCKRKKKFIRIDGKTDVKLRQQHVDQFQEDEETQFAILSILAVL